MGILIGVLLILWGLALMGFGLMLYYSLLPLWYGLFGALVGFFVGDWLTGGGNGWFGSLVVWLFAIGGAALFAFAAYQLEPYRHLLAGILMGIAAGELLASLFGGGTFLAVLLAIIGAIVFAVLAVNLFNPLLVAGSSVAGAALIMDGVYMILPSMGFLADRTNAANDGNFWAIVVWIVLALLGIGWQWSNLSRWVHAESYTQAQAA